MRKKGRRAVKGRGPKKPVEGKGTGGEIAQVEKKKSPETYEGKESKMGKKQKRISTRTGRNGGKTARRKRRSVAEVRKKQVACTRDSWMHPSPRNRKMTREAGGGMDIANGRGKGRKRRTT